jgi:hypothetical protein
MHSEDTLWSAAQQTRHMTDPGFTYYDRALLYRIAADVQDLQGMAQDNAASVAALTTQGVQELSALTDLQVGRVVDLHQPRADAGRVQRGVHRLCVAIARGLPTVRDAPVSITRNSLSPIHTVPALHGVSGSRDFRRGCNNRRGCRR